MILKNGFIKTDKGGWINLSKILAITVEKKENQWGIIIIFNDSGDGIIVESYDTMEEAVKCLDNLMNDDIGRDKEEDYRCPDPIRSYKAKIKVNDDSI